MCSQGLSAALIFKWLLPANSAASRALLITSEFINLHRLLLGSKTSPEDCSWRMKSSLTDVFLLLVNPLLAQQCRQGLLHQHITFKHVTERLQAPLELEQEVFREQWKDPRSLAFFGFRASQCKFSVSESSIFLRTRKDFWGTNGQ